MSSPEALQITPQNKEIIAFATKAHPLSESQLAQLNAFSQLDNEWRMLLAIGNRYTGTETRLSEVDGQRNQQMASELDPVLAGAIREYINLVEVALFENEP